MLDDERPPGPGPSTTGLGGESGARDCAELGPRGVRVHNIDPGLVRTELGEGMLDDSSREQWVALRGSIEPMEGADIGAAIAWAAAAPLRVNVADMVIVSTQQG